MNRSTYSLRSRWSCASLVLPILLSFCALESHSSNEKTPLLLKALKSQTTEDLKQALAEQEANIKAHPNESRPYAARVYLTDKLGQKGRSKLLIAEMLKKFDEATCYFQIAEVFETAGDYKAQLAYDDLSLAKRPHPHVFANRANSLRLAGRFKESIESANRALALGYEDKAVVYEIKAETYAAWKKPKEAIEEFGRAISADSNNANRYWRRGEYLHSVGKNNLARQDLTKAIKLNGKDPRFYKTLFHTNSDLNYIDGMHSAASKAYKLSGKDSESCAMLDHCIGREFQKFTQCADKHCLERCDKLVAQYSRDYWPYTLRAKLNAFLTYNKPALADYTKAIKLGDRTATTYEGRANMLMLDNKVSEAIEDYTKAIAIDQNLERLYVERAEAYRRIRLSEKAISDYSRIASKSPKNLHAYRNLGKALVDQGRLEEAVQAFSAELKNFPLDSQTYADRAQAYLALNQPDKALSDMNNAIELKPKQPILYRNRAKIHEKMGNTRAAESDQTKADSFGKALIDY